MKLKKGIEITLIAIITIAFINLLTFMLRPLFGKEIIGTVWTLVFFTSFPIIGGFILLIFQKRKKTGTGMITGSIINALWWVYIFYLLSTREW